MVILDKRRDIHMSSNPRNQPTYPPLLKKADAAALYAVSTRTFDRWLQHGVLPADAKTDIGGSVRFRTAVLLNHIADNRDLAKVDGGKA